jgi:hypothetical protein
MLAPTVGTASGREGCKKNKKKGSQSNESALRDVDPAAIGQQVLVLEAATSRGRVALQAFEIKWKLRGWGTWIRTKINGVRVRLASLIPKCFFSKRRLLGPWKNKCLRAIFKTT